MISTAIVWLPSVIPLSLSVFDLLMQMNWCLSMCRDPQPEWGLHSRSFSVGFSPRKRCEFWWLVLMLLVRPPSSTSSSSVRSSQLFPPLVSSFFLDRGNSVLILVILHRILHMKIWWKWNWYGLTMTWWKWNCQTKLQNTDVYILIMLSIFMLNVA